MIATTTFAPGSPSRRSQLKVAEHRRELGEFLRFHRDRLQPEDLGLRPGARRRAPGLKRDEVAAASSISTAWYTWLEQGRPVRPSIAALKRIATTLRLSEHEGIYLRLLSGHGTERAAGPKAVSTSIASTQNILDSFTHRPALLYNARFDVLAANSAARAMYGADIGTSGRWANNMIWRSFMDADRRRMYPDAGADLGIRNLIEVLRMNSARPADSGEAGELVDELRHSSGEFDRIWRERRVAGLANVPGRISPRGRDHPVNIQYSRLYVPDTPGHVIAAIIPTDPESATTLDRHLNSYM